MAKKRPASRKPTRKPTRAKKGAAKRQVKSSADSSRLDTAPLQDHIRKRIKDIEDKYAARATAVSGQEDDTLNRLKVALETLQDICEPTMTIPI